MLHTLRCSPWQTDISALLRLLKAGDDLLLIEDGVTAAIQNSRFLDLLLSVPITLYALQEDIAARGLSEQISHRVVRVDYTGFVRLTVKHPGQMAW